MLHSGHAENGSRARQVPITMHGKCMYSPLIFNALKMAKYSLIKIIENKSRIHKKIFVTYRKGRTVNNWKHNSRSLYHIVVFGV